MIKQANIVIIDDEQKVRKAIKELILNQCPELNICGEADSVNSAYQLILKSKPDLVFLDIEMPGGSGFDLLKKFDSIEFHTIFVTAYDQYAIRAIKFSALDYILKPMNSIDLLEVVQKYWKQNDSISGINNLLQNLQADRSDAKIAIPSVSKIQYVKMDQILYCEAEGAYTQLYLMNGNVLLSTKILKDYEVLLSDQGFFRLHRSYLINLKHVVEYGKNKNDSVKLSNGNKIQFSRKFRSAILEALPHHK